MKTFSSEVLSAENPGEVLYSDQYFFSATRSLQKMGHVTDNVTVVTREELDRWAVGDLDEALGIINGIVVQDNGFMGQTATAQIYGSREREVRVMVDGITFNATTTGGIADLSQIPLDIVEKIEIIKGASSSVWGSAMGGVINIITRPPGEAVIPHGNAQVSFGEYRTQRERGEIAGAAGPLHYYAFGSYADTGGFRANSDVEEKRGFLKQEIPLSDKVHFLGSFGYSDSKVSEFDLFDIGQSQQRKVISRYGNAGISYAPSEKFTGDIFYKISERTFRRTINLFPSRAFLQLAKAQSMIHEISLNNVWTLTDNQRIVMGSDIAVEVYHDAIFRATTTRADVNKESTRHSYFANYQLSLQPFDFTLGSRLDATNSYGINFDPSFGAVYHLPLKWETLFRMNVSRAFNAPSLVDRYLSVLTTVANPDLEAEKAIAYNLGFETMPCPKLRGKAVFFQTFVNDSIQTITRSDGLRQPVNIARERRTGFETDLAFGPWYGFSPSYGTTFTYVESPSGVLMNRPRFTQDLKLTYFQDFSDFKFNAHLAGRYMDLVQYSGYTPPIDQTFIFNAKVMVTFPTILYGNFSVFVEAGNLFNNDFSFDGERNPNPQRHFEAGVKYGF